MLFQEEYVMSSLSVEEKKERENKFSKKLTVTALHWVYQANQAASSMPPSIMSEDMFIHRAWS